MIVKKERYYIKKINRKSYFQSFDTQKIKQTSFWLLGIIPLYIKNEVIEGQYEF